MSATQFDIDLQKREGRALSWQERSVLDTRLWIRNRLLILSTGQGLRPLQILSSGQGLRTLILSTDRGLRPQNSVPSETPAAPLPSLAADVEMSGGFPKQGLVNFTHSHRKSHTHP